MNAERLLGQLIKQGLKKKKKKKRSSGVSSLLGTGGKAALGMGALGVAIAAFEHFTQKQSPGQTPPGPPSPGVGSAGTPPPPPPPRAGAAREGSGSSIDSETLLLVRAMIAAANADGEIDFQEKAAIMGRLEEAGADFEEKEFVREQLEQPPSVDSLLRQVETPELARQVFAVSLLAIDVDTQAERDYLDYLQRRLRLDDETVEELRRELGGE